MAPQQLQSLTEKEKQTLRLLVVGYDAKSMARHLGLSVHTINERLRDARRKLATSSSREAARQLREAEAGSPQLLVDTSFGAALPREPDHTGSATSGPAAPRRAGWIIGGTIMLSFAIAAIALSSGTATAPVAVPFTAAANVVAAETEAAQVARNWLELGDAGRWDDAYAGTSAAFQSSNTSAHWSDVSRRVRVPLGALRSRVLISDDDVPTPPSGARIVKFRTSFAGKPSAIETLALVRENGAWKVTGIYLE